MSKTFQPDSLHPYIMDARLKKATGSGGISNIPIASADTLGVVKAGDGVLIDADGAISVNVAYTSEPVKTGVKIGQYDEYAKIITLASSTIIGTGGLKIEENVTYNGLSTIELLAGTSCAAGVGFVQTGDLYAACQSDFTTSQILVKYY